MKLTELLEILPKAQAYELKRGGRYLVCFDQLNIHPDTLNAMAGKLDMLGEREGIKFVGLLNFMPRIFELEPEKE